MNQERKIELEYIAKAKKNRKFFGFLYEKYYRNIYIFIFKKIQNEELTDDICSRTFMKAMLNITKYEDRGFPFSSWLYRIASNEVNLFFREQKKGFTVEITEKDLFQLMDEVEEDRSEENQKRLLIAIEKLPLEQSELIEMRFFEQISFREIGNILQTSEASAKMRVYRILEKLKKELGK